MRDSASSGEISPNLFVASIQWLSFPNSRFEFLSVNLIGFPPISDMTHNGIVPELFHKVCFCDFSMNSCLFYHTHELISDLLVSASLTSSRKNVRDSPSSWESSPRLTVASMQLFSITNSVDEFLSVNLMFIPPIKVYFLFPLQASLGLQKLQRLYHTLYAQ